MDKKKTVGVLAVLLLAGAGIASAFPMGMGSGPGGGWADDGRGSEMREALVAGDWEAFSGLAAGCENGSAKEAALSGISEEAFLRLSELAVMKEEMRALKAQIAEENGFWGRFGKHGAGGIGEKRADLDGGFGRGRAMGGFGRGPAMGGPCGSCASMGE
jgi:hypothetical protein